MDSNYSLADIAAATGDTNRNDGFLEGNGIIILILFFLIFGFGGNGYGNGNGALTRGELCQDMNFNQLENGVRGIQQGLCDGFYAQNTTMLQGFNNIGQAIANNGFQAQQCCCETNRNIDAVRAENYRNTCEITTAIHNEAEQTRALMTANEMQNLRDQNQAYQLQLSNQAQNAALISALRPTPIPAYITCSPYQAAGYCNNFGGSFNNGCSGCNC